MRNSPESPATAHSAGRSSRRPGLSTRILFGLALGIACGLFFGEYCAWLAVLGDVFVALLRMTVLPFIVVALTANLGRLSVNDSRRLASAGGRVLLSLWAIGLLTVFALPLSFPTTEGGSFFSNALIEQPPRPDLVDFFVPSNIFRALSDNHVPAVVLASICAGLALSGVPNRERLLAPLDTMAEMLMRVSQFIAQLAPVGVFAIAARAAGTMSFESLARLQVYAVAYTGGAVLLAYLILPLLVSLTTPVRYRDVLAVTRAPMLTAFATGKLIIVLPMLVAETEALFRRMNHESDNVSPAVLYPIAYPFPHLGKLLGLLFIPFASWFLGKAMGWPDYPLFLISGLFAYFGGPVLATPFLLDQMQLPHDMFQLFLLSGVFAERLGDALGAMHLTVFTLLTSAALAGQLKFQFLNIMKFSAIAIVTALILVVVMRVGFSRSLASITSRQEVLAQLQLLEDPVKSVVLREPAPSPDPLLEGETLLQRIKRRGKIRVGYNEDNLPFAYFNVNQELVGYDINMAHALARDLGVQVEFVRFERPTIVQQLEDDQFDIVMSGLVGTVERAETMQHTQPYLDVTLSLVVPDHRSRSFKSIESIRSMKNLRIGFVALSRGFVGRLRERLPEAELVELPTNREFFESPSHGLDCLLISAESGAAFTMLYPDFEVVVPLGRTVSLPLFYVVGAGDQEMTGFLEHWIALRKSDGTMQEFYDHWILGKSARAEKSRWSVVQDVLGWLP